MSKSNKKKFGDLSGNRDDRKKVNRSDRKAIKDILQNGNFDSIPKKQKLRPTRDVEDSY